MLSTPNEGWTVFSLGEHNTELSYLTDIPNEWLDEAIFGLKNMVPFTVKAALEPGRLLCTVSFHNCYIFCEDECNFDAKEADNSEMEPVHVNMIEFCQMLYDDLKRDMRKWIFWDDVADHVSGKVMGDFAERLELLKYYIDKRQEYITKEDSCIF